MTKRRFDHRRADPPSVALVRKLIVVFVIVHVPLALWSGYRAIVQVQRLELRSPTRVLQSGSSVRVDVVGSGRVTVDVQLELVQATRVETLGARSVPGSRNPAYDPRFRHGTLAVVLTPHRLGRFQSGPALLRATAHGRPQWLRTPPPTVREVEVEIRHQSARSDAGIRPRRG